MKKAFVLLVAFLATLSTLAGAETQFIKYKKYLIPIGQACGKPKVIVTTDFADHVNDASWDPNEDQDLVHFLIYSHMFDIKGIVASSQPNTGSVSAIKEVVNAFDTDHNLLSAAYSGYPAEDSLDDLVFSSSQAATAIKNAAEESSPVCPLNVLVWGAAIEVVAGLDAMNAVTRKNVRVIAIGSTNRTEIGANDTNSPAKLAWDDLEAYINNQSILEGILLDGVKSGETAVSTGNDTFRGLSLAGSINGGDNCTSNGSSRLYHDGSIERSTKWYMDQISIGKGALGNVLHESRTFVHPSKASEGERISYINCNNQNGFEYTIRIADATTTLYLLADVIEPALKNVIENDLGRTSLAAYREEVFEHFLDKMNAIY